MHKQKCETQNMRHNIIFSVIFMLLCNNIYSQHRKTHDFEIKTGIGLEQGINLGINRYYTKNSNVGIGIGSHFPSKANAHHLLLNLENNFHFILGGKKNEFSILFNQQAMFWRYSEPDFTHYAVTCALNTGFRSESQSGFGFIFEIGPSMTFTLDFDKDPNSDVNPITRKIQPNFRLLVFQRF